MTVPNNAWSRYSFLLRLGRFYHQMLSAVVLNQSTVSLSRAVKSSVPFGVGTSSKFYRGQAASMWSAVCSSTVLSTCRQLPRGDPWKCLRGGKRKDRRLRSDKFQRFFWLST